MKEKEFDRIVRELQNGKRELLKRGITFCLSGRSEATGQTWYASNREKDTEYVYYDDSFMGV